MKRQITVILLIMFVFCINAYARMPGHHPPVFRPGPMHHALVLPHARHHHHHSSGAFWTGVGIGLIDSPLVHTIPPPPPVVVPTVIGPTIGRIWVPPVYESRPVYDRFGNLLRYEQVMVSAGYWR